MQLNLLFKQTRQKKRALLDWIGTPCVQKSAESLTAVPTLKLMLPDNDKQHHPNVIQLAGMSRHQFQLINNW